MNIDSLPDMYRPYSQEVNGDLSDYLRDHDCHSTANHFYGSKYFFFMKDKGLIVPGVTYVRVTRPFVPDFAYFVNSDFLLQSNGPVEHNMSLEATEKGVFDPEDLLRDKFWSVIGLDLS